MVIDIKVPVKANSKIGDITCLLAALIIYGSIHGRPDLPISHFCDISLMGKLM